jgi:hypothetical protein
MKGAGVWTNTSARGESAERLFLSFAQPSNHTSLIPLKTGRKQAGDISENDEGDAAARKYLSRLQHSPVGI